MKLIEKVIEDGEEIIYDIFLSGFHSVQPSLLERLDQFSKLCEKAGAKKGEELSKRLRDGLNRRISSFDGDISELSKIFSQFEFYIRVAKKRYL